MSSTVSQLACLRSFSSIDWFLFLKLSVSTIVSSWFDENLYFSGHLICMKWDLKSSNDFALLGDKIFERQKVLVGSERK